MKFRKTSSVLLLALFILSGCKKTSYKNAKKIYEKEGLDSYSKYVEEFKVYYQIEDEQNSETPLLLAMKNKNIPAAKIFLQAGANPSQEKSKNGKTFAEYFLALNTDEKCEVAQFVPASYWSSDFGMKKYSNPAEFLLDNDAEPEAISFLLSNDKISPDRSDLNGKTLLMFAAQRNTNEEILNSMIKKSKNINAANRNNWNALMYAARYNPNPSILEILLKNGAEIPAENKSVTVTMLAACNPNPGVLLKIPPEMLKINSQSDDGKTALIYACENKQDLATIQLLVDDYKSDVNLADINGKTALDYASASYPDDSVSNFLRESGASIGGSEKSIPED